ncbi:MAG: zinc-dependent alcohol dehydrogenase [Planctomycetota bacterium]|jgi:L-iditol 2-dehydrogenase
MKTAFKRGEEIDLRESEQRPIMGDEIRIRITACGICGTDLHVNPDSAGQESAFGHEMAGVILEVGERVTDRSVGEAVVIESSTPCGRCAHCRNAEQELCTHVQSFFCGGTFGFAEEAIVPAICAIPIHDMDPAVASLSEPLGVAIDLVRLADIRIGSNVLVMGPGPIGLMAVALAKRAGAGRIFVSATSRRPVRAELAKRFGADEVIYVDQTELSSYDFGCDIDRVLHTTAPATLNDAFQTACKGAIISFIGIAHGEGAFCTFDVNAFHFKKLQLRASFASPALFTARALDFLRDGVVDGEALISHRFPLGQIEEAMRIAREDASALKVIVVDEA